MSKSNEIPKPLQFGEPGMLNAELADKGSSSERVAELRRIKELLDTLATWCAEVPEKMLFETFREIQAMDAQKRIAEDQNHPFPDYTAHVAKVLRRIWLEEGKDLTGISTMDGFCGHERHSWFKIQGDIERLCDNQAIWVFDPWPRGVYGMVTNKETSEHTLAHIIIVAPHSPLHTAYRGGAI